MFAIVYLWHAGSVNFLIAIMCPLAQDIPVERRWPLLCGFTSVTLQGGSTGSKEPSGATDKAEPTLKLPRPVITFR